MRKRPKASNAHDNFCKRDKLNQGIVLLLLYLSVLIARNLGCLCIWSAQMEQTIALCKHPCNSHLIASIWYADATILLNQKWNKSSDIAGGARLEAEGNLHKCLSFVQSTVEFQRLQPPFHRFNNQVTCLFCKNQKRSSGRNWWILTFALDPWHAYGA